MTRDRFASRDQLDETVVQALRDALSPPGGDAYWTRLESVIMARLDAVEHGWWGELAHWVRPALIAAAVLIMTATAAVVRTSQAESHAMYENVVATGNPLPLPEELTVRPVAQGDREETLRFLFGR